MEKSMQQNDHRTPPVPFEPHESGAFLHGTKAKFEVGAVLSLGQISNFEKGRISNHVYFTKTLDASAWGAELAAGDGHELIYIVEPLGQYEDDPNVTDKRFPGNPTLSFRSADPVRIVGELAHWTGHTPEQIAQMRNSLAELEREGRAVIDD